MQIVTVTSGPQSRELVELATVKDELGLADASQDAKLNRLIAACGRAFSGAEGLEREPWRQVYSEQLPGGGGIFLRLSRWPVESVSSVQLNGEAIAASSYSIAQPERSALYREDGWDRTLIRSSLGVPGSGDEDLDYTIAYTAGWLMPGQISDWAATTAYALNSWTRSSSAADLLRFECTTAGTSGGTEPTWPTTAGDTVADGTVVWTARAATELPEDIFEVALVQVKAWFRGGMDLPMGIQEKRIGDISTRYDVVATRSGLLLMPAAKAVLRTYR